MTRQEHSVSPAPNLHLDGAGYPWLAMDEISVPSVEVSLPDGDSFRYASVIGLSNPLSRMANEVSPNDSDTLNGRLMKAVPDLLRGLPHQNTMRIPESEHIEGTLFVAGRNFRRHPFLLFVITHGIEDKKVPAVLRVGTGQANDYPKALSHLGVTTVESGRCKSR